MAKTTVKPGNSHINEGGRMPSTSGNKSGSDRGNNPPTVKGTPTGKGSKK